MADINKVRVSISVIKYLKTVNIKYFILKDEYVDNKRMASEIPTHMPNPEKYLIPGLKFSLRALVICGLFNTTKIFTKKVYIVHLILLVFSNSELLKQFLNFLHIVCCVNKDNFIKELFCE